MRCQLRGAALSHADGVPLVCQLQLRHEDGQSSRLDESHAQTAAEADSTARFVTGIHCTLIATREYDCREELWPQA